MTMNPIASQLLNLLCALGLLAATAPALAAQDTGCDPLPGWEEIAAAAADKYLVFGELHGTEQSPAAVAEYVCAVSEGSGAVLVAVEYGSPSNPGFQTAWAASPSDFRDTLIEQVRELHGRNDGVASEAMLSMLARIHRLKSDGRDIDIVAFNGARDDEQRQRFAHLPSQEPHEAAQAENIRMAAQARHYDHVVVLVGSTHARKEPAMRGQEPFDPMAMKLAPPDEIISLLQRNDDGQAWTCRPRPDFTFKPGQPITQDDIICAAHVSGGDSRFAGTPRMALWQDGTPAIEAYDGYYYLGPITASPPAVPAKEPPNE